MKLLGIIICTAVMCYNVTASSANHGQYKELELNVLKSQPEEYKNKKVCYTSTYEKYMTTFPSYAVRNGFKVGRYIWLLISPINIPVVSKKTKEMNELITSLKRGSKVKVYGRIKKFRQAPYNSMLPRYYLDLDNIMVVSEPKQVQLGASIRKAIFHRH